MRVGWGGVGVLVLVLAGSVGLTDKKGAVKVAKFAMTWEINVLLSC